LSAPTTNRNEEGIHTMRLLAALTLTLPELVLVPASAASVTATVNSGEGGEALWWLWGMLAEGRRPD
jgi:hypothetical protein